jgi:hypothetical protein
MRVLPFTLTAEALACIQEVFRTSEAKKPELTNRVRTLGFAFSSSSFTPAPDGTMRRTSHYPHESFHLGWQLKEVAEQPQYTEWVLGGMKVVIHADTLERLRGKQLVMETVEVGYPNPADKTVRLLKAV